MSLILNSRALLLSVLLTHILNDFFTSVTKLIGTKFYKLHPEVEGAKVYSNSPNLISKVAAREDNSA